MPDLPVEHIAARFGKFLRIVEPVDRGTRVEYHGGGPDGASPEIIKSGGGGLFVLRAPKTVDITGESQIRDQAGHNNDLTPGAQGSFTRGVVEVVATTAYDVALSVDIYLGYDGPTINPRRRIYSGASVITAQSLRTLFFGALPQVEPAPPGQAPVVVPSAVMCMMPVGAGLRVRIFSAGEAPEQGEHFVKVHLF